MLTAGAGALAVVCSLLIFPLQSDNNDESIYLLQAESLKDGRLFPPAPKNWESFMPALSVWRDGHFVPKYTPVQAGFIAIADALTGTQTAALALIGSMAVATFYLLARQVLATRRIALLASIFFALSPLTLIQSATFLSYLSALALMQGFAAALLAGVRRESRLLLWISGFLAGIAFFSRPFDTVLFGAPLALWLIYRHRDSIRTFLAHAAWIGLGAALPLGAMLAFFYASTGGWFDSPFNLIDPSDTVGFGSKRMYPRSPPLNYWVGLAVSGMLQHLALMAFWCFGGFALAALAVSAWKRMDWNQPGSWLGLMLITVPFGYFFFWGSFGAIKWSAPFRLGPYYYIAMLTPLSILGAAGFERLWAGDRRRGALVGLAMFLLSVATFSKAIVDNGRFTQSRHKLYGPLLSERLDGAIVFLPKLSRISTVTHPFALARNDPEFSGKTLWALDRGMTANLKVLEEFPGRVPYRLVVGSKQAVNVKGKRMIHYRTELERLPVPRGLPPSWETLLRSPVP